MRKRDTRPLTIRVKPLVIPQQEGAEQPPLSPEQIEKIRQNAARLTKKKGKKIDNQKVKLGELDVTSTPNDDIICDACKSGIIELDL